MGCRSSKTHDAYVVAVANRPHEAVVPWIGKEPKAAGSRHMQRAMSTNSVGLKSHHSLGSQAGLTPSRARLQASGSMRAHALANAGGFGSRGLGLASAASNGGGPGAVRSTGAGPAESAGSGGAASSSDDALVAQALERQREPDLLPPTTKPDDFVLHSLLGRGTLGRVFLAEHRVTGKYYAIKRISRLEICKRRNMASILQETHLMDDCSNPFLVHQFAVLQDEDFIYLVLTYAGGGELYTLMEQRRRLPEEEAKFYFAEIAWGIQYLHNDQHIAFRDVKPENILLDHNGHVKICDFGFAVRIIGGEESGLPEEDACGTSQYMAPELISTKFGGHGFSVDWWALGCVLYEMLTGSSPFGDIGDLSKFEIFMNISKGNVKYPSYLSKAAKDLIRKLLTIDKMKRFRWEQIKTHEWLADINWTAVRSRKLVPPLIPSLGEPGDRHYFPERRAKNDTKFRPLGDEEAEYSDVFNLEPRDRSRSTEGAPGGGGGAAGAGGRKKSTGGRLQRRRTRG